MTIASNPSYTVHVPNPSLAIAQTSKVKNVQTTSSKQLGGKKKNKEKYEKSYFEKGGEKFKQPKDEDNKTKCKVKYPCMVCKEDYFMKDYPHLDMVLQYLQRGGSYAQLMVMTNPFPPWHQQMIVLNPKGHLGHPPQEGPPSNANIMILNSMIGLSTQDKNYNIPEVPKDITSTSQ